MYINEIFKSIQGEGSWTGLPNIFIRTTGCNLRCTFCDTKYAYHSGKKMSIFQILKKVEEYSCRFICITGGEPLLQQDIGRLIDTLLEKKLHISIETNGSHPIAPFVKKPIMISLDIKCPSSKMHQHMDFENLNYLRPQDQIKYVIKDKHDYEYAKNIITQYQPKCLIYFQPVWGVNPKRLWSWILDDDLPVRFGIQLHKILWGTNRKK